MKIELTDKVSGKKFAVDAHDIMLMEALEGGGTHIVLDPAMGRAVVEEYADLKAVTGVVDVPQAQALMAPKALKASKKK